MEIEVSKNISPVPPSKAGFLARILIERLRDYQLWESPWKWKWNTCAHNNIHKRGSCSHFVIGALKTKGLLGAIPLVIQRYRECTAATDYQNWLHRMTYHPTYLAGIDRNKILVDGQSIFDGKTGCGPWDKFMNTPVSHTPCRYVWHNGHPNYEPLAHLSDKIAHSLHMGPGSQVVCCFTVGMFVTLLIGNPYKHLRKKDPKK